jgi:choline dehydrogenase-like flavoprotein
MKSFDFIVVGGGTSGTVTAEKLIKNGHTVLLLEEGKKNSNPILAMPAGWIPMLDGSPYLKFYKSIPQPQLNNSQHDIAQAKILGGGSSINGMVYMRGKPSDYNKWVEETGDKDGVGNL